MMIFINTLILHYISVSKVTELAELLNIYYLLCISWQLSMNFDFVMLQLVSGT